MPIQWMIDEESGDIRAPRPGELVPVLDIANAQVVWQPVGEPLPSDELPDSPRPERCPGCAFAVGHAPDCDFRRPG